MHPQLSDGRPVPGTQPVRRQGRPATWSPRARLGLVRASPLDLRPHPRRPGGPVARRSPSRHGAGGWPLRAQPRDAHPPLPFLPGCPVSLARPTPQPSRDRGVGSGGSGREAGGGPSAPRVGDGLTLCPWEPTPASCLRGARGPGPPNAAHPGPHPASAHDVPHGVPFPECETIAASGPPREAPWCQEQVKTKLKVPRGRKPHCAPLTVIMAVTPGERPSSV